MLAPHRPGRRRPAPGCGAGGGGGTTAECSPPHSGRPKRGTAPLLHRPWGGEAARGHWRADWGRCPESVPAARLRGSPQRRSSGPAQTPASGRRLLPLQERGQAREEAPLSRLWEAEKAYRCGSSLNVISQWHQPSPCHTQPSALWVRPGSLPPGQPPQHIGPEQPKYKPEEAPGDSLSGSEKDSNPLPLR